MAAVVTQQLPQALSFDSKKYAVNPSTKVALSTAIAALKPQLSDKSAVYYPQDAGFEARVQRFSDYKRPMPGAVICPATEQDLASTVAWATSNGIKFLARAGGHGWSMTLSAVGPEGVLINLREMNEVTVDLKNGLATLEAGVTTGELLKAGHDADAHIVATACDSVGAIPSIMGGGIGNLVSNYGLASDNILSARLVTATGSIVTASATENSDLFWAIRGAGHNFGIVSQLTVKAYPQINGGQHWSGTLGFPGSNDIAQKLVNTIREMGIVEGKAAEGISCTMVYGRPKPTFEPSVLLKLSYNGSKTDAMSAFAPFYEIAKTNPPSIDESQVVSAAELNESKDSVCSEGGSWPRAYRPVHSASVASVDPSVMGQLYERWEQFTAENEAANESIVRVNFYDYRNVQSIKAEESAFAWRQNAINVLQYWAYTDENMHNEIQELGQEFREALNGNKEPNVIMSFATGDETPQTIYGERLEKIRDIKQKWDPTGAFSFYNSC